MQRFSTFREFWPYYLQEHAHRVTRVFHYVGTTSLFVLLFAAFCLGRWTLLMALPVAGYGFAWTAHAFVEHNRPATFRYPLWSLGGDFLMFYFFLCGRITAELALAGVRQDGTIDPVRRL